MTMKLSLCIALALLLSDCSKPSERSAAPGSATGSPASQSPAKEGESCGMGPKPTASCEPPLQCVLLPVSANVDAGPGAPRGVEHAPCGGVGGLGCAPGLACSMPDGPPAPDQMGNCARSWICEKDPAGTTTVPNAKSPAKEGESCGVGAKPTNACEPALTCKQVAIPGAALDAGTRRSSSEHGKCGGIGNLQCAAGLVCEIPADEIDVKDAMGACARSWTCVKAAANGGAR